MLLVSTALVFALGILSVHGRAQSSSGTDPFGLGDFSPNCICTPFYRCYDVETSSDTQGAVDDRVIIVDNRSVITVRQEGQPGACPTVLDICCHNLFEPAVTTPSIPSLQPQPPSSSALPPQITTFRPPVAPSLPAITARPTSLNGACNGVRNINGAGFSIAGFTGGQAQYGEFPWMVAVLTSNTGGFGSDMGAQNLYVGGGSLIHPQVVLTAAHKAYDNEVNKTLTVRLGEWNFRAVNEPHRHQDIPVSQIIYHPRFDRIKNIYNYALLVLENPAVLGETVGTICLPSNPGQNFDGEQCILSGWGKDIFGQEGRYQRILKLVNVNIVGYRQCQSALRTTHLGSSFNLHRSSVCAGDQGQDACTGDGGSPLVCADPMSPGQYVQVGITAWGIKCGQPGIPGVYAAVAPAIEWIHEILDKISNPSFDLRQQGR